MDNNFYDVIIIGAGPSGLMCASNIIKKKILLIDKNEQIGGKIKVSGGGRCNVTNLSSDISSHIIRNNKFLYSAFSKFNNYDIYDFFEKNNVKLKVEDYNRVFPVSNSSQTIIEMFKKLLIKNNVNTLLNYSVSKVSKQNDLYIVDEKYKCKNLVIATGGITYQNLGTTGDGYEFLKGLDHTITELFPTEVALVSNDEIISSKVLQGITLKDPIVKLYKNDKLKYEIEKNILFTHFGLSGPSALHMSYFINEDKNATYYVKIKPQKETPKKLINHLNEEEEIIINISDTKGFKTAFVTAGGLCLKEINPKTFESKINEDLYVIGEVLDINAFTGGYNLTVCFSEGYSVSQHINTK